MVLVDVLPVQRLRHLHPACLLLNGEDALGGSIRSLPSDAVENLCLPVPVGFDLGGDAAVQGCASPLRGEQPPTHPSATVPQSGFQIRAHGRHSTAFSEHSHGQP